MCEFGLTRKQKVCQHAAAFWQVDERHGEMAGNLCARGVRCKSVGASSRALAGRGERDALNSKLSAADGAKTPGREAYSSDSRGVEKKAVRVRTYLVEVLNFKETSRGTRTVGIIMWFSRKVLQSVVGIAVWRRRGLRRLLVGRGA
jgi:hypothetical protein